MKLYATTSDKSKFPIFWGDKIIKQIAKAARHATRQQAKKFIKSEIENN